MPSPGRWTDVLTPSDFTQPPQSTQSPEDVLFVSVGGGAEACALFQKTFPNLRGRIVSQEQAGRVELEVHGVESAVVRDFTNEQGVLDARAYYIGPELAARDDDAVLRVLQMHLPALRHNLLGRVYVDARVAGEASGTSGASGVSGTSIASTSSGVSGKSTASTQTVTNPNPTSHAGHARTRSKWHFLTNQAGLEMLEVRPYGEEGACVIIARRRVDDGLR